MRNHSNFENLLAKCIYMYVEIIQISYYSVRIILSYKESAQFTETALIPSEPFECLSVHLSALHFGSIFGPILFKLCMDIDIREELFGIANGLNLYINNSYGPLLM